MKIKNLLRKPGGKLVQIVNRSIENDLVLLKGNFGRPNEIKVIPKAKHEKGQLPIRFHVSSITQFEKLFIGKLKLSIHCPNNCILLKIETFPVFLIENIVHFESNVEIMLIGKTFKTISNLFSFDIPHSISKFYSSALDIFKVSSLSVHLESISLSEMKFKTVKIPIPDEDKFAISHSFLNQTNECCMLYVMCTLLYYCV